MDSNKVMRHYPEWLKVVQLLIVFLSLLFISEIFAQEICDLAAEPTFPPSPYSNAYLKFDGKGDFLRTNDINALEFDTLTTNNVVIETSIKITKSFSPQYIMGKYYGSGWIFGYHTAEVGYISFYIGNQWNRVYYLGNDTLWHEYRIVYTKQDHTLKTYVDQNLTNTYSNFYYGNISNNAAFSIGNAGFLPQYGYQTVNLYSNWFGGMMDFVSIKVNSLNVVKYDFNEHAGQFAKDSASYYISDRTYPGEEGCGSRHLMLGFNPTEDTCDPEWVIGESFKPTNFSSLGLGLRNIINFGGTESQVPSSPTGMTVFNGNLVVCGNFNTAGETAVKNIAKWNGQSWSSVGSGFNYEPNQVLAYGNELYAIGYFDTATGFGETRHIAKWNGESWSPLGNGLSDVGMTMEIYNGELIAGGFFISSGEVYSPRIARWDGSEWHSMGWGMTGPVYALCVYNGDLYAGGDFEYAGTELCNGIARWDGSSWHSVGIGLSGGDRIIRTLKIYNGELYAGGSFSNMNGTFCRNIAKYDGISWAAVGGGATGYNCSPSAGYITDLQEYNNELYAIGLFTKIGGVSANKIAKWDGSSWCAVEYGIDLAPRDLIVFNGSLIVCGDLLSISANPYNSIAAYTKQNLTGIENQNVPKSFSLYQNYPNPFNPATTIKYRLPSPGNVKLEIFDAAGRLVSTPDYGFKQAGEYTVSFNAASLSSGVYFYRLEADLNEQKVSETKKMLLIK